MNREVLVEIVLALVIILLIVAIREIRIVRSELQHTYATQPYPTIQMTLSQTPLPTTTQAYPRTTYPSTSVTLAVQFPTYAPSQCSSDKDCGSSWCTDAIPPSCYEEQCISGKCTTTQTSWHGTRQ
jgi:hypothetical protein